MKYMFASDIHGSAWYCRRLLEEYRRSGADRLILLGDLLYHGPRNDLPREYAPKEVIAMLNALKAEICAVRGNCEAEVDQMVLEFPVMADYALLALNGLTFYATHGHVYNQEHLPPMKAGDILIHGHTHLLKAEPAGSVYVLNPGSVSIPKGGNPASYAVLEEKQFRILDFDGNVIKELELVSGSER
jgi:phosphoesterase, MJ0936 family